MIGICLMLHFGFIHLLSNLWRTFGLNAPPIMRWSICAASLSDFWSCRWNTAFSVAARRLLLIPLARRFGLFAAGIAVFLASGLIHELVISLPAGGGFGLPTLYFFLQGAGVVLERSRVGRACGLGRGIKGRLMVILFVAGPVCWLFHPAFLHSVMIPFLQIITKQ